MLQYFVVVSVGHGAAFTAAPVEGRAAKGVDTALLNMKKKIDIPIYIYIYDAYVCVHARQFRRAFSNGRALR